jgi:hypothetical protein
MLLYSMLSINMISIKYCTLVVLMGPWHEFFDLWFFHRKTSPRSLIQAFWNIASNFRNYSTKLVAQQCQWHHSACHFSVNDDTTVHVTSVSMTPQCMSLQCQWHHLCKALLYNYDTTFTLDFIFYPLWNLHREYLSKNRYRQIVLRYIYNFQTYVG